MGGFKFIGPNYTIQNEIQIGDDRICRCVGYTGEISEEIEKYFLNKSEKTLNIEELPDTDLIETLQYFHLGDQMKYIIRKRAVQNTSQDPSQHPTTFTSLHPTKSLSTAPISTHVWSRSLSERQKQRKEK